MKRGVKFIVFLEFVIIFVLNSEDDFCNLVEEIFGLLIDLLLKSVKDYCVYIVGGLIIEKDLLGKFYNMCFVFDLYGCMILKYRKIYFFKIDCLG